MRAANAIKNSTKVAQVDQACGCPGGPHLRGYTKYFYGLYDTKAREVCLLFYDQNKYVYLLDPDYQLVGAQKCAYMFKHRDLAEPLFGSSAEGRATIQKLSQSFVVPYLWSSHFLQLVSQDTVPAESLILGDELNWMAVHCIEEMHSVLAKYKNNKKRENHEKLALANPQQ